MTARLLGNPELLQGCKFRKEDCRGEAFSASTCAVGVGALGDSFEDCKGRFGEFLAVAGSVAYLPTDGTNVPDYFVPASSSVPDVQVCYAAAFEGPFEKMVRFEAKKDVGAIPLTQLVEASLEVTGAEQLGMVMVAESAGLMGAALRRPPTQAASPLAPFEFPNIRNWLMFTADRAHARSLALVVGVAARGNAGVLRTHASPARIETGSRRTLPCRGLHISAGAER